MIRKTNILVLSLALSFSLPPAVNAVGPYYANNGLLGDWDTAGHWTPAGAPPTSIDQVNIGHASGSNPATMTISSVLAARNSQYMYIGGNGGGVSTGTLNVQNAQILNTNGYLYMAHGGGASSGTLLVDGGSSMTATSGGYISANANGQSTITVDGAGSTLSIQGNGDNTYLATGGSGARATINLSAGSTLNTGNQGAGGLRGVYMGSQGNDNSYAMINIGPTSMWNVGNNVAGQYGWMAFDGGDSGGNRTYDLPLALNPNTAGKIFLGGGIERVASGASNKVTVNISTTGAKPSEATLDWHNNRSFRVADGSNSIGIVNLTGTVGTPLTINNATYYMYLGQGSGSSGTLNMTYATFTNSGTGDPLRMGGGGSGSVGTLNLASNSTYTQTSDGISIGTGGITTSKAVILLDGTSKINLSAGGINVNGRDNSFAGDVDTPAQVAVYTLPLANAANSAGKIYANRGVGPFIANASDSKVEVNLTTSGGAGVASDASINAGGNGILRIAEGSNSIGIVNLDGVSLSGYYYNYIGTGAGSDGRFKIKNATFTNSAAGDHTYLGQSTGKATLTLDNGTYVQGSSFGSFYNRFSSTASSEVRGRGAINNSAGNRTFFNDGRVVADGGTLSIGGTFSVSSQNHPIAQSSFGQAGWYATTGSGASKLVLPTLSVGGGDPADIQWGETAGDTTLDLVNSLQIDFASGTTAGTLDIALLATDHSSVYSGLVNPLAVFDIVGGGGLAFNSFDLDIRYDDDYWVNTLGLAENATDMNLFHYTGGSWVDLGATVNAGTKIISATGITSLSQFAIAQSVESSVVPEPSTYALGLIGLAGLGLIVWRRRLRTQAN